MTPGPPRSAPPGWPLTVIFIGLPLWWLLGVWQLMFLAMAVPMAVYLLRLRHISTPKGFWVWLLWLGWLLTGLMVLQVDAPGAVPGTSMGRYLTFGLRFSWYVAATIVSLYVLNTRRELSRERISRLVAWFFVMLVGGGLLGTLMPTLSFPSALQLVLPGALGNHQLVHDLVHVQVAQVQTFLGAPQPRPSAPFPYTNDWGLATAATMPFFVVAWWKRGRAWRIAMMGVSAVAVYVIVSSVNRGMWGAIIAMAIFVVARSIMQGKVRMLLVALLAIIAIIGLLVYSPLGELVQARLDNPHSDEGRANLGLQAVQSTVTGSPVVGFGTTRDVAGNFSSIAGGATPDCPHCEPPPLGTHGQLWLTVFGAGFVGAALFLAFLISQLVRNLGARSPDSVAALCSLIVLTVTLPIYSSTGVALYIGFIAIGLLARENTAPLPLMQNTVRPVLSHPLILTFTALLGALSGLGIHAVAGTPVEATQRVLVPAAALVPVPGVRPFTLDGEALLSTSAPVIRSVSESLRMDPREARQSIRISAEPNTRVLVLTFTASNADQALQGTSLLTTAYLEERARLLTEVNDSVSRRNQAHLDHLGAALRETIAFAPSAPGGVLVSAINDLRKESLSTAEDLLTISDSGMARTVSSPTVAPASDIGTVRIASGIAVGLLLGVACAHVYHRRFLRLGTAPAERVGLALPLLTRVHEQDTDRAELLVRSFLPVAGLAADPDSARSLRMAARLDEGLTHHDHEGQRTLIVVDSRSRVGTVRRLHAEQVRAGLQPVGLILCEGNRRRG